MFIPDLIKVHNNWNRCRILKIRFPKNMKAFSNTLKILEWISPRHKLDNLG
jgi:hypothetical protein